MWKRGTDSLWLFGGYGFGNSAEGSLNDLWCYKISTNTWTWIKGDSSVNIAGVYDQSPIQNKPGSRSGAVTWKDANGSLWLFGGNGYINSGSGDLNDLWKYNVSTNIWTWVKGDNAVYTNGEYGTQGISGINNKPGSRSGATAWIENNNLWLFGGSGNSESSSGNLNDLWKYNTLTNEWTWVKGDKGQILLEIMVQLKFREQLISQEVEIIARGGMTSRGIYGYLEETVLHFLDLVVKGN